MESYGLLCQEKPSIGPHLRIYGGCSFQKFLMRKFLFMREANMEPSPWYAKENDILHTKLATPRSMLKIFLRAAESSLLPFQQKVSLCLFNYWIKLLFMADNGLPKISLLEQSQFSLKITAAQLGKWTNCIFCVCACIGLFFQFQATAKLEFKRRVIDVYVFWPISTLVLRMPSLSQIVGLRTDITSFAPCN